MTDQPPGSLPSSAVPGGGLPLPLAIPPGPQSLSFTGSGGEYFKIWIVNLLLTIVTLGIYSAWAKVRRSEYFYRHTRLAGAGFDYHGKPLAILKGRIIGALLFGGYYAAGLISPTASIVAFIVLMLVLPFFIVRALRFRLYNTSYRGLRFGFAGGTREAYAVFLGLGLATLFSLFTLLPLWVQRQTRYVHANARYGRTPFTFDAPVAGFYRIYLIAFALAMGGMLLLIGGMVAIVAAMALGGSMTPESPATNVVAIAAAIVASVVYLCGTVGMWSFITARVQNLVWSHTQLGPHRFKCDLRARSVMFVLVTNLLGIVLTLGLYKPFADVRWLKYLAGAFALVPGGSLDDFLAGERQLVGATGEEAVEMFDVDLAF